MKLNNKGYMLVEIILASAIAFGLAFFIIDLTIKLKNKNDDLMVESLMNTDRTIINNKLMSYVKEEENKFDCKRLEIEGNVIKYKGNTIGVIKEYATINKENSSCSVDEEYKVVSINIKASVPQMPDKEYDISLNYNYHIGDINKLTYKCEYEGTDYLINYTGKCIYEEENNNWKIKFLTSGTLTILNDMIIDAFLVGGGGGGGGGASDFAAAGGGGGGGYTKTKKNITIANGTGYHIIIGAGGSKRSNGGDTTAFGVTASGGKKGGNYSCGEGGCSWNGGNGGSGGGGGNSHGGSNGGNGKNDWGSYSSGWGGFGQIAKAGLNGETGNTCEFGEVTSSNTCICPFSDNWEDCLYSGGGGSGCHNVYCNGTGGGGGGAYKGQNAVANRGGGGGGGDGYGGTIGKGGSGIVIIRNKR